MTFSGFPGPDGQIVVQPTEPMPISVGHPDASYSYNDELGMWEKGEPLQYEFDPTVPSKTEWGSTIEILGTEFVDDKLCIVVVESSESIRTKSWIWQKTGLPLRMESTRVGDEEPEFLWT